MIRPLNLTIDELTAAIPALTHQAAPADFGGLGEVDLESDELFGDDWEYVASWVSQATTLVRAAVAARGDASVIVEAAALDGDYAIMAFIVHVKVTVPGTNTILTLASGVWDYPVIEASGVEGFVSLAASIAEQADKGITAALAYFG